MLIYSYASLLFFFLSQPSTLILFFFCFLFTLNLTTTTTTTTVINSPVTTLLSSSSYYYYSVSPSSLFPSFFPPFVGAKLLINVVLVRVAYALSSVRPQGKGTTFHSLRRPRHP